MHLPPGQPLNFLKHIKTYSADAITSVRQNPQNLVKISRKMAPPLGGEMSRFCDLFAIYNLCFAFSFSLKFMVRIA